MEEIFKGGNYQTDKLGHGEHSCRGQVIKLVQMEMRESIRFCLTQVLL